MILFLLSSCNELRIQSTPKWLKICLECVCIAIAFFFPLTYLWLLVEDGFLSGYCSGNINCDLIYRDLTTMYSIAVAILLETVVATVITIAVLSSSTINDDEIQASGHACSKDNVACDI